VVYVSHATVGTSCPQTFFGVRTGENTCIKKWLPWASISLYLSFLFVSMVTMVNALGMHMTKVGVGLSW
jgi:hypothetical protein